MPVAESLDGWTDWDLAAYALGQSLGVFDALNFQTQTKGIFWSDNPLGRGLSAALDALAAAGVIERGDEPDVQSRWLGETRR